jgi:hypothetical protein
MISRDNAYTVLLSYSYGADFGISSDKIEYLISRSSEHVARSSWFVTYRKIINSMYGGRHRLRNFVNFTGNFKSNVVKTLKVDNCFSCDSVPLKLRN